MKADVGAFIPRLKAGVFPRQSHKCIWPRTILYVNGNRCGFYRSYYVEKVHFIELCR